MTPKILSSYHLWQTRIILWGWDFVNCASNRVLAWIFGYSELDYDPIELFFLAFYMLSIEETDASMEEIVGYFF